MAAVTIAEGPSFNVAGIKRHVTAKLTAPANGDTWNTGLSGITSVLCQQIGAAAAADAVGVSVSGGTITFNVVGTARDLYVTAHGN